MTDNSPHYSEAESKYEYQIARAAEILACGGVVAFPTDTVYGLGADIRNEGAVERVYSIKGRPQDNPLPVLISDISRIGDVVSRPEPFALHLASRFWPGGLTLVLRTDLCLANALLHDGFAGVRVPDDPVCRLLIERLGGPITGTSANLSGHPPAVNAKQVRDQLGSSVDYILDAGRATQAKASTVVRVVGLDLYILREGAVPSSAIMRIRDEYLGSQFDT